MPGCGKRACPHGSWARSCSPQGCSTVCLLLPCTHRRPSLIPAQVASNSGADKLHVFPLYVPKQNMGGEADFFGGGDAAAPVDEGNPFGEEPASDMTADPTPVAPPAPMAADDPRIGWAKKNAEALVQKDREEAASKVELLQKAQAFLKTQAEVRRGRCSSGCVWVGMV